MRIGDVVGTITLNIVHPSLTGARFKLVAPLSWDDLSREKGSGVFSAEHPSGRPGKRLPTPFHEPLEEIAVLDELGAGIGSRIAISEGREAAMPFHPEIKPVDAYNAAILDSLEYDPSEL